MASEKLRSIRRYLFRNARALDVARWNYHFEDGPVQEVLKALACYQNVNGGFAHGLEPDIRTPESNPMSTWTATRILRETGFPAMARQMISGILDYLENTLMDNGKWPATTESINGDLHAPWFEHQTDTAFFGWNPTIELAAFILLSGEQRPTLYARAEEIVSTAMSEIQNPEYIPDTNELSNICEAVAILMDVRPDLLPGGLTDHLKKLLSKMLSNTMAAYASEDYILTPDFVLNSPMSPWYPAISEAADFYAKYLEESVTKEGYWEIPWNWGEMEFPAISVRDWQGSLTVDHMLYLEHFKPLQDEAGNFLKRV